MQLIRQTPESCDCNPLNTVRDEMITYVDWKKVGSGNGNFSVINFENIKVGNGNL